MRLIYNRVLMLLVVIWVFMNLDDWDLALCGLIVIIQGIVFEIFLYHVIEFLFFSLGVLSHLDHVELIPQKVKHEMLVSHLKFNIS